MEQKKCPFKAAGGICKRFVCLLNLLQPVLLLVVRIYIGYQSVVSGWGHLHNINNTAGFFKDLNIPMPRFNSYVAGYTELVGGGLFLVGLASRLVCIPFTFNFVIAILSVELHYTHSTLWQLMGKIWDNQNILLNDTAFPFMFAGLMVLIFGPGVFSLDYILAWLFCLKHAPDGNSSTPQSKSGN